MLAVVFLGPAVAFAIHGLPVDSCLAVGRIERFKGGYDALVSVS